MLPIRAIAICLAVPLLAACQSPQRDSEGSTSGSQMMLAEGGQVAPADDATFRKEFEEKLERVIAVCQPILGGMEERSSDQAETAFYLSMAGLVSGAVIAPALTAANASANAAWIAGFSGFGGAAGFAGKNYESLGLNGRGQSTQRNDIVERFRTQMTAALDTRKTKQERFDALSAASVECLIYKTFTPTLSVEE